MDPYRPHVATPRSISRMVAARQLTWKAFAIALGALNVSIFSPGFHSKRSFKILATPDHGNNAAAANSSHHRSAGSVGREIFGSRQTELVRVSRWPYSWKSVYTR